MAQERQAPDPEQRDRTRSNAAILGLTASSMPPTLNELEPLPPPRTVRMRSKLPVPRAPVAWDTSNDLADLLWRFKLDSRLPAPSRGDHPVYLISAVYSHLRRAYGHWSFYSQGHFFHLTAPRTDSKQLKEAYSEPSSDAGPKVLIQLRVQNLVSPDQQDYVPLDKRRERNVLRAFNVGYTRLNVQQLRQLAEFTIGDLKSYNFFSSNCQLFATEMMNRAVMFQKDGSIFVGNIDQIVQWDARAEDDLTVYYSRRTGYLLTQPRSTPLYRFSPERLMHIWPLQNWNGIRIDSYSRRIRKLYEKGDLATGAFDPSGERVGLRYIWHGFCRDTKDIAESMQFTDMMEDFRQKRWHDFWYGRLEWRKASYMKYESEAERGDKITRVLLPFYRLCLDVTEAERTAWFAETAAR